ncbi:DUF1190 domain-containing protein [Oceaniglobus roseus]|uniref:DUF1190 domain-containing protein n=1 Tax=Oceaniglobus roseus TaxID=1737570 RepID=UPI000C7F4A0A|nr:DUF1190 domain-containing protein [Kandeliimicrobium roseum]
MRPRSRSVALTLLGAAAFTLAGCQEEQVDAQAYPDLASCKDAADTGGLLTIEQCETAFAEAQQLHVETAPRYDSLAVCEEQHGEGACGSEAQQVGNGGSGSIFMPLLAGYLIGNLLGGRGMAGAQPMYRTQDGRFTTPGGTSTYSSNRGTAKLSPSAFSRPPTTVGKAPMTKTTTGTRGGFGRTGGARGFGVGG